MATLKLHIRTAAPSPVFPFHPVNRSPARAPKPVRPGKRPCCRKANVISPAELACIRQVIADVCKRMGYPGLWRAFAWRRLRKVAGVPAPFPFENQHIPALRGELAWLIALGGLAIDEPAHQQCLLLQEYEALN